MSNLELACCSSTSLPYLQLLNIVWVTLMCVFVDVCICATIHVHEEQHVFLSVASQFACA